MGKLIKRGFGWKPGKIRTKAMHSPSAVLGVTRTLPGVNLITDDAVYLGIDPGEHGGLAWIRRKGQRLLYSATTMPDSRRKLWEWFCRITGGGQDIPKSTPIPFHGAIELVGGYIGERENTNNPAPGSAMFNFGVSYGSLLTILDLLEYSCGLKWEAVHPRTWQTKLHVSGRGAHGEGHSDRRLMDATHKATLKNVAQQLFPTLRVTLYTADALLLAEYTRRKVEGIS